MDPKSCTACGDHTVSKHTSEPWHIFRLDQTQFNIAIGYISCVRVKCAYVLFTNMVITWLLHVVGQLDKLEVVTHFKSGDTIPLGEFPEHQAEISIHQVVYLLRAVDSGDITQLWINRRVKAHKPRDDTTLPGQHLRSSAATGRLVTGGETLGQHKNLSKMWRRKCVDYETVPTSVTRSVSLAASWLLTWSLY